MTRFVWTDIETTGLDPTTRHILAVGFLVTDENLNPIAELEETVRQNRLGPDSYDQVAWEMHGPDGTCLREASVNARFSLGEVETIARHFILKHGGQQPIMAGSSVHFDHRWLSYYMPGIPKLCHYRMLDVSVFKVLAGQWGIQAPKAGRIAHTPLADIRASIQELQTWRRLMFKPGIGPELPGLPEAA